MIVVMQFRSLKGPYCQDCGIATLRNMSGKTMWQGWWGFGSLIAAPVTLLINVVHRIRFAGMVAPVRKPGSKPPIDKGKPLYLRPVILGLAVPLFVAVILIAGLVGG
jgi:hypothetical protein